MWYDLEDSMYLHNNGGQNTSMMGEISPDSGGQNTSMMGETSVCVIKHYSSYANGQAMAAEAKR